MTDQHADAAYSLDVMTFDLDGTLVDTANEIADAVNLTLADFDMPACTQAQVEVLIGAGSHELMRQLLLIIDPQASLDQTRVMARLDQHYAVTAATRGVLYPGVKECLSALRESGVRLACVTNKEARHAQRVLDVTGLSPYFELLIGGDTLAWNKPDARVLAHAVAAMDSVPARAAHVGDSLTDILAARHAGVADWAVPWGYNAGRPVAQEQPSQLFSSFAAIAAHALAIRGARLPGAGAAGDCSV